MSFFYIFIKIKRYNICLVYVEIISRDWRGLLNTEKIRRLMREIYIYVCKDLIGISKYFDISTERRDD